MAVVRIIDSAKKAVVEKHQRLESGEQVHDIMGKDESKPVPGIPPGNQNKNCQQDKGKKSEKHKTDVIRNWDHHML